MEPGRYICRFLPVFLQRVAAAADLSPSPTRAAPLANAAAAVREGDRNGNHR